MRCCKKCGLSPLYVSVTRHEFIFKTGIEKTKIVRDANNDEYIYTTGYCRMCLIDMGYCD